MSCCTGGSLRFGRNSGGRSKRRRSASLMGFGSKITLPMRKLIVPLLALLLCSCVSSGPPTQPNDKEWNLLSADYQWLQTLRNAQPVPPPTASRKQQIEILLANHDKIAPTYNGFIDKLKEYYGRTGDPRAAAVLSREKVIMGDQYMNYLARYDSALKEYRDALQYDPSNA